MLWLAPSNVPLNSFPEVAVLLWAQVDIVHFPIGVQSVMDEQSISALSVTLAMTADSSPLFTLEAKATRSAAEAMEMLSGSTGSGSFGP